MFQNKKNKNKRMFAKRYEQAAAQGYHGRQYRMAAQKIQSAWRRSSRTCELIAKYFECGPCSEHVQRMSFDDLVPYLREKPVITICKRILQRIHFLCLFRNKALQPNGDDTTINVRVFLCVYMIAFNPSRVFHEEKGNLEMGLKAEGTHLIVVFEEIMKALMQSSTKSFSEVPHELTNSFPTLLYKYLASFKTWKIMDEGILSAKLQESLLLLYKAKEFSVHMEDENKQNLMELETNIARMRSKLQGIAGRE